LLKRKSGDRPDAKLGLFNFDGRVEEHDHGFLPGIPWWLPQDQFPLLRATQLRIRELAAWGLDHDEYRPLLFDGDADRARALVAGRTPFENRSALVESADCGLRGRLAEQESRADLRAEMAGLDWFLGVVDLRRLIAFQRRIVLAAEAQKTPLPAADDCAGLMNLCFGEPKAVVCEAVRGKASVVLRSMNPNLHFRITDDSSSPIVIHSGSPFFEVAQYRDRWFLRDGYHRAFRCLQAGVFHLPAVGVRARTLQELGAVHPWFFPEEVLFSGAPPRVFDFLDDALVIEYHRSPLIKTLRITVEETYTFQGESL
jgi:hypothetical protein